MRHTSILLRLGFSAAVYEDFFLVYNFNVIEIMLYCDSTDTSPFAVMLCFNAK